MKENKMIVTGNGTANASPDYIEIYMELISTNYDYNVTMNIAKQKYDNLLKSLIPLGFRSDDLKTINFSVNAEYKATTDSEGVFVNEFVGYRASQSLLLGFPFNLILLNNTINAINESRSAPNININFTLKDKDLLTNIAIEDAVRDAYSKANVLASSGGVSLLNIINIDYTNRSAIPLTNRFSIEYSKTGDAGVPLNISPDDIKVNTDVTITWEIA